VRAARTGQVTAQAGDGYFQRVAPARKPGDLRASDEDRERVVAVLAAAAGDGRLTLDEHSQRVQRAYQARTLGELASLTRDLVPAAAQPLHLDDTRLVTAFFATARRDGRWVVPDRFAVTAVGGQVILDLREALLLSAHTSLHATLIGGRLHLVVPEGVQVLVTDVRHPGRAGADQAGRPGPAAPAGTPLIEVRTFGVAGRVQVHTPRRPGGGLLGRLGRRSGRSR
jgi:hypothetical protein